MKNLVRNLFLALTGLCLAALAVFLVQLIIINSGNDSDELEPSSSLVVFGQNEGNQGGEGPIEPVNPFENYEPEPAAPRPPPQGTPRSILVDTDAVLVIYADDAKFDYVEEDLSWRFNYRAGGSASLEISHWLITQSAGAAAEAFLNSHLGEELAEFKGTQPILESELTGFSVSAFRSGTTYEGWLYRLPNSDLALAFLLSYEFNNQRDDLYEVLSSIDIEIGGAQANET